MKNYIKVKNTKESKMKVESGERLIGADGLRAIACLSVIIHHLSQQLIPNNQPKIIQELQKFGIMGNTGVSIFFILSGFLLSYPFWRSYLNNSNYPSLKAYSLRRAARIIPGYYIAIAVSAYIIIANNVTAQYFWMRVIAGVTFTSCFNYKTFFPSEINGPLWSISFEVFCYFLMPIFMYGLFRIYGKKRTFFKAFSYWMGALAIIVVLNRFVHLLFTPDNVERGWQYGIVGGAKYWMPNYNPIALFGHFYFGIIAAGITNALYKYSNKIEKYKQSYIFDIIGIMALVVAFIFLWVMRDKPEFSFSIQNQPYFYPFYQILIAGALAILPHTKFVGGIVDNIFFRYTAKVSFGLYLWHYIYITIVKSVFMNTNGMPITSLEKWGTMSIMVLLMSYITATISYKFIEMPVVNFANRRILMARSQNNNMSA